ncbi:nitronate monooxygenase family protein [Cryobacterium sp. HLT2-28]|uniref:NAD(P)H-dependent flavin oxidoreductase n=1 Tax=Cryobacterium sp. HLT2-28 TaxID=1259146 RepID=UPI00106CC48F|nr:nitronate monooxygenase [Cryobacterium sp. HLT2-28]TFB93139.1 2-nitropropane dioxygenase [Cryobacterium sp. HLT2-28]
MNVNLENSWARSSATRLLGIDLPIVLAPFGGLSNTRLTAAVSEAGGLGSYGLFGYGPDRISQVARELALATSKPFALNLWLPLGAGEDPGTNGDGFDECLDTLRPYFDELGIALPQRPAVWFPSFDDQITAALDARPAVLSFVFGVPSAPVLDAARSRGILTVGTATTVDEAVALDAAGLDAIVATGMEAGGHRVSFLASPEDSLVGTFALVPQIVDAVSVPVIAAGGIADGRGLAAAIALGAGAAVIGSAFLATEQSAAAPVYRAALRGEEAGHTVLTRALSGRLARGIPNRITRDLDASGRIAAFPVQNWVTGRFRPTAAERGIDDLMSLWAGQGSPLIRHDDALALIDEVMRVADTILRPGTRARGA